MAVFLKVKLSTQEDTEYGTTLNGAAGDHIVVAKADAYTGRNSRVNKVVAKSADSPDITATSTITQLGSNILLFQENNEAALTKTAEVAGGNLDIVIVSNAQSITPTFTTGTITAVASLGEEDAETDVPSGSPYTPAGDPGATEQYEAKFRVKIAENESASQRTANVTFEGAAGVQIVLSIVQTAANPTITLLPTTASIQASGGTTNLNLSSNDDWDIEVVDE